LGHRDEAESAPLVLAPAPAIPGDRSSRQRRPSILLFTAGARECSRLSVVTANGDKEY
jgi:hypothetical protein